MYKPHYLNVKRETKTIMVGNIPYWTKVTTVYNGRKKEVERKVDKSGRHFKGVK